MSHCNAFAARQRHLTSTGHALPPLADGFVNELRHLMAAGPKLFSIRADVASQDVVSARPDGSFERR
jgi:hypothetical protein